MLNLDLPEELIEELAKADFEAWVQGRNDWESLDFKDREDYHRSALAVVKRFLEYVDEQ